MKKIIFILLLGNFLAILSAAELNICVDENRFFSESGDTILEINYQFSVDNLTFIKVDEGFSAKLGVTFSLNKNNEEIYSDVFTNRFLFSDQTAISAESIYTDKISFTILKSNLDINITFTDINSEIEQKWYHQFGKLRSEKYLSDLEFLENLEEADSTKSMKFVKDGKKHLMNCNHIFNTDLDSLIIYYEQFQDSSAAEFTEKIKITKEEEIIFEQSKSTILEQGVNRKYKSIDIDTWKEGYYEITVSLKEKISNRTFSKKDYFSLKKKQKLNNRIFPQNLEDEYQLISYFFGAQNDAVWKRLSNSGKINFISRFWNRRKKQDTFFLDTIKNRIRFCNNKFSSHNDGWKTDRGRIYIKHGTPDEIIEKDTGLFTKYAQKEYQIWKYRQQKFLTYIFIDYQMNGSFRLIYSDMDNSESSWSNWQEYLGKDFDSSLLE